jgi:hypothetical protein
MPQKRTTLRSRAGTKPYAKRSKTGEFTDIQMFRRAHGGDVQRRAAAESAGRKANSRGPGASRVK